MTKLLVCLLFAAAVVAANPFVETFLSEVSVDSAHQFVELHCAPAPQPIDLAGWRLVTSTSACTLSHAFQDSEFLVIDSEALAIRDVGHGTFRLNPLGDSLFLIDDTGRVEDSVHYPRYPAGYGSAPLPPATGSVAFWNYDDAEGQWMNWYIDSTPTLGGANNDYSVIAGSLTGTGGVTLDEAAVAAGGQCGSGGRGLYRESTFSISGLGAGTYQLSAGGYYNGHAYFGFYPESVTVGYSQSVGGIDFVIPLAGVAETQSAPLLPSMRVSGRALLLSGDGTAPVIVQLYNQVGSRVGDYDLGPFRGEKRIELPATFAPGIYFATARKGTNRSTAKIVLW
jgi:hypothetical protein